MRLRQQVCLECHKLLHDGLNHLIRFIVEKIYCLSKMPHHHEFSQFLFIMSLVAWIFREVDQRPQRKKSQIKPIKFFELFETQSLYFFLTLATTQLTVECQQTNTVNLFSSHSIQVNNFNFFSNLFQISYSKKQIDAKFDQSISRLNIFLFLNDFHDSFEVL